MSKNLFYILAIILLITDLGYTFSQFQHQTLDGDIARCILPAENIQPVFENPFGVQTILNHQPYVNPNRFFCHWTFKEYMRKIPLLLQSFVSPIDSVYLASSLFKTGAQLILMILLAFAVTGKTRLYNEKFLLACLLITPFFQTNGYRSDMGIIDPSITYTFFYAFPTILLLVYFLPYHFQFYHNTLLQPSIWIKWLWIPLALIVCLSGPLNTGIILTFTLLFFTHFLFSLLYPLSNKLISRSLHNKLAMISKWHWFYILPVLIASIYSLYLGTFNSQTIQSPLSLSEMYSRLPIGIYHQFTQKIGFPLLFLILLLYVYLIKKYFLHEEGIKIIRLYKWIFLFSGLYIILLPLGGYRDYRPEILRYDTILPITLLLIFLFVVATLFIHEQLATSYKRYFTAIPIVIMFVLTNADRPGERDNHCEKEALHQIAKASDSIVVLNSDCTIMDWRIIDKPEQSLLNAQIIHLWKITATPKLYYQK